MDTQEEITILRPRAAMMARLLQIHDVHAEEETTEGSMIVTFEGYLSGISEFFSQDFNDAFVFKDRAQAESFVAEFADALKNPQVLDFP